MKSSITPKNTRSMVLLEETMPAIRAGHKVRRDEWPLGQYVVMQPGYPAGIGINANTARATGLPEGTMRIFRPYLLLQRPDLSFVPYVASTDDILGTDWRDLGHPLGEPVAAAAAAGEDTPVQVGSEHVA